MKLLSIGALAAFAAALVVALPAGAQSPGTSPIVNGSFETGDFTGWTVSPSSGGGAAVIAGVSPAPSSGVWIAELTPGAQNQPTTVSQIIPHLGGGFGPVNQLKGWANFDNNDCQTPTFNDSASVIVDRIVAGFVVSSTTVFSATSCGTGDTGWRQWTYNVPGQGAYRIRASVTNIGDSLVDSLLYLDAHTYQALYKVTP